MSRYYHAKYFLAVIIFLMITECYSQANIEQLSFIAGNWIRKTAAMKLEQFFLQPAGGTITGLQRRTRNDSTLVSFFFIFQEEGNKIICRFKHFENNYTTYEDRNKTGPRTFTMIEIKRSSAIFEERTDEGSVYLRYRKTDQGQLEVAVGSLQELRSNKATSSLYEKRK